MLTFLDLLKHHQHCVATSTGKTSFHQEAVSLLKTICAEDYTSDAEFIRSLESPGLHQETLNQQLAALRGR